MGKSKAGPSENLTSSLSRLSLRDLKHGLRALMDALLTHAGEGNQGEDAKHWNHVYEDAKLLRRLAASKCEPMELKFERAVKAHIVKINLQRLEKQARLRFKKQQREEIRTIADLLVWHGQRDPILSSEKGVRTQRRKIARTFDNIAEQAQETIKAITDLLKAMGGVNGPLGRISYEINKLPPPFDLQSQYLMTSRAGFGRPISDLNRARDALKMIALSAGKASDAVVGKGEPKAPKAYGLFKSLMISLHEIFRAAGGKGKGVRPNEARGRYEGRFLISPTS